MHRRKCKNKCKNKCKKNNNGRTHTHGKDFFLLVELRNVTKRRRYLTTKVKHTIQCLHVCISNNILFKRFFILYLHTCCSVYALHLQVRTPQRQYFHKIYRSWRTSWTKLRFFKVKSISLTCNKGVSYLFFTFKSYCENKLMSMQSVLCNVSYKIK